MIQGCPRGTLDAVIPWRASSSGRRLGGFLLCFFTLLARVSRCLDRVQGFFMKAALTAGLVYGGNDANEKASRNYFSVSSCSSVLLPTLLSL